MYSSIKLAALCSLLILEHYKCTHTHTHMHTHPQDGFFPLHGASQEGHSGIVEMLLQAGAIVDLQTKVEDCYYDSSSVTCSVPLAVFIVH